MFKWNDFVRRNTISRLVELNLYEENVLEIFYVFRRIRMLISYDNKYYLIFYLRNGNTYFMNASVILDDFDF